MLSIFTCFMSKKLTMDFKYVQIIIFITVNRAVTVTIYLYVCCIIYYKSSKDYMNYIGGCEKICNILYERFEHHWVGESVGVSGTSILWVPKDVYI